MDSKKDVVAVFTSITDQKQMAQFFEEIFTNKEVKDIALRWQLLCDLHQGESQRSIAVKHGISLCKITRGARILKQNGSVAHQMLQTTCGEKHEQ